MSWFKESPLSWLQSFCAKVLKAGRIPKHIAIIMDGNRRFAVKESIQRSQGHMKGFDKLTDVLQWCKELEIEGVTVYAFSTENFKRSKEEVDGLMELARTKFETLFNDRDKLMENGIRFRVFGNLSLLPEDIQKTVAKIVLLTKDNNKCFFNVCMAYTSREEMFHAAKTIAEGVDKGLIEPDDVTEDVFQKCLYSFDCPDPDLLLRTSGEVRLSDFLLWQSCYSVLAFVNVLWPEFSIWDLFSAVLYYQLNCDKPMECRRLANERNTLLLNKSDWKRTLESFNVNASSATSQNISAYDVAEFRKSREHRVNQFLEYVTAKRLEMLENMANFNSLVPSAVRS